MNARRCSILWFRSDLRLEDNPAVSAATAHGDVVPVYIWDAAGEGAWGPGGASKWWLHQSLKALAAELCKRGSHLIVRKGPAREVLSALMYETGAQRVFCNRRYEPHGAVSDVEAFDGNLLVDPDTLLNRQGNPYQVFTPFWKSQFGQFDPPAAARAPRRFPSPKTWPAGLALEALELEPKIDWAAGLRAAWEPGERGAQRALERFLDEAFAEYPAGRDRPDWTGTSRLSPHLHFGEVAPRQIWRAVRERAVLDSDAGLIRAEEAYLRQLVWREFAYHLLIHFPHTPESPLRSAFARFPWKEDAKALDAWQRGRTGYPLVDAGMRELWATGWMHNRVRMVAASFLVKHLLIPWQCGAKLFWDTLVDADLANNTFGWQWTAGCGADAAPYFRVFNPVLQGEKFDPDGGYIRRWIPELAKLPSKWIHRPWQASPTLLADAGVSLGNDYPRPIIEHDHGRERALAAYHALAT